MPKFKVLSRGVGYIFVAGIVYGIFSGVFFAINADEGVGLHMFLNVPGMLLGDQLENTALRTIGDIHSDRAFYTIPWLLREPAVYVVSSLLFWGGLGYCAQCLVNLIRKKKITK